MPNIARKYKIMNFNTTIVQLKVFIYLKKNNWRPDGYGEQIYDFPDKKMSMCNCMKMPGERQ